MNDGVVSVDVVTDDAVSTDDQLYMTVPAPRCEKRAQDGDQRFQADELRTRCPDVGPDHPARQEE